MPEVDSPAEDVNVPPPAHQSCSPISNAGNADSEAVERDSCTSHSSADSPSSSVDNQPPKQPPPQPQPARPFTAPLPPGSPATSTSTRSVAPADADPNDMLNMINQLPVPPQTSPMVHDHHRQLYPNSSHLQQQHNHHLHHHHFNTHLTAHLSSHRHHPYAAPIVDTAAEHLLRLPVTTGHITVQLQSLHCEPIGAAATATADTARHQTDVAAAGQVLSWHPHVYAKGPRSPTPHSIVDILGGAKTATDRKGSPMAADAQRDVGAMDDAAPSEHNSVAASISDLLNSSRLQASKGMRADRGFGHGYNSQPNDALSPSPLLSNEQPLNLCIAKVPDRGSAEGPPPPTLRKGENIFLMILGWRSGWIANVHMNY